MNAVNDLLKYQQSDEKKCKDKKTKDDKIVFSELTMVGALAHYVSTENTKFQPMNANFGILPPLEEMIRDKKIRYTKLADRALKELKCYRSITKVLQSY